MDVQSFFFTTSERIRKEGAGWMAGKYVYELIKINRVRWTENVFVQNARATKTLNKRSRHPFTNIESSLLLFKLLT